VIKIDGMGSFDEVFARISAEIENGVKGARYDLDSVCCGL
jgi:hypothetical protein